MKNETLLNKVVDRLDEGNGKIVLEHLEKTEGKERFVTVCAKSVSLIILALGGVVVVCICAYRIESIDSSEVLKIVSTIITGVLSFFAGRTSR